MVTDPSTARRGAGRIDWGQVGILYRRELRAALRERNIVINSVLLPILLYPVILWASFSGMMFVQGQTENFQSRIAVPGWPENHPGLRARLLEDEQIRVVELEPDADATGIAQRIRQGRLDALVEIKPATEANAALVDNFTVEITYNESKDRSTSARQRVAEAVERYRSEWLAREAVARGLAPAEWQRFTVTDRNVASARQTGTLILGMMLPLFFVIMVAIGTFYPAVDATAGERERNTWETLMTLGASRVSIVTAKYLYVGTMGGVAGLLNLAAMTLTMKPIFAPMVAKAGENLQFSLPLGALPLLVVAALLLAGFVAAVMMILASFARTFKEGQAFITPFYLVIMMPVMFLQTPGLKFSLALAFVPIVNVVMLIRSVVGGAFPWPQIAITLVVSGLLIAACLRFAAFILRFEDVMLGSYSGSLKRFLVERVFRRGSPASRTSP